MEEALRVVLGVREHGSGDVTPVARRTGEMATVDIGRFSHKAGRYVPEHVEMELLATDDPVKYGTHARKARDVDRLLAHTATGGWRGETPWEELYVTTGGDRALACGWHVEVEECPVCAVTVIWNLWSRLGWRVSRRTDGPYPCSERCRSRLRRPEVDLTRSCEHCGERFTPARKDAKTCSTRCRVALHRARNGSQPVPGEGPGSVTGIGGGEIDA